MKKVISVFMIFFFTLFSFPSLTIGEPNGKTETEKEKAAAKTDEQTDEQPYEQTYEKVETTTEDVEGGFPDYFEKTEKIVYGFQPKFDKKTGEVINYKKVGLIGQNVIQKTRPRRFYETWWFWTGVAVFAGAITGSVYYGISQYENTPAVVITNVGVDVK